jgi:hypothetical protein
MQAHGKSIRVPISVAHERWDGVYAWDQAVGIAGKDRHPVA